MNTCRFVRRGRPGRVLGKWYVRFRTRCGRAAIARARVPGYATAWFALRRAGEAWLSIETRPDGLPRRYRSRAAAARAVLRFLRRQTGRSGTERHEAAQGSTKSHTKTQKATRNGAKSHKKARKSASTSVRGTHRGKRRSGRAAA